MSALQLRQRAFQRFAVGMIRPRIVVTFVLPQFFVYVRRGLIDGRDNRSRCGIRLLSHMNGVGGKSHRNLLAVPRAAPSHAEPYFPLIPAPKGFPPRQKISVTVRAVCRIWRNLGP